jgi:hypothetical protein
MFNLHSEIVILFRQHCGPIVTISQPADAGCQRCTGHPGTRIQNQTPVVDGYRRRQRECAHKAGEAKVIPRDRTAFLIKLNVWQKMVPLPVIFNKIKTLKSSI